MIKKFFIIVAVFLTLGAGGLYYVYSAKKILITPYPYSFNTNATKALESEIKQASSAKILIVGDRMGKNLDVYTPGMISELAQSFKNPPEIYNWSKPHEGLHRTIFKLKSLKKLPSIIIYHGASSELFERTFSVSDAAAINHNFKTYDDEKIISLIITFPWLSKVFYKKMDYFELGEIKEYKNRLPGQDKMSEKELSFKFFDYQMRELIDLVKDKKSQLILITTPLNLEVHPLETCAQSTSNTVIEVQQEIEELIKSGEYKTAFPKILELSNETYSNAKSFYLLGKVSMNLGDLSRAREAFQKATIFDCANWRGNAVLNAIMKIQAEKRQVRLIDFDQLMAGALSQDGLFSDDLFPQNIFYQRMTADLLENLKKILSVND